MSIGQELIFCFCSVRRPDVSVHLLDMTLMYLRDLPSIQPLVLIAKQGGIRHQGSPFLWASLRYDSASSRTPSLQILERTPLPHDHGAKIFSMQLIICNRGSTATSATTLNLLSQVRKSMVSQTMDPDSSAWLYLAQNKPSALVNHPYTTFPMRARSKCGQTVQGFV